DGVLEDRRRPGVVDNREDAGGTSQRGEGGDVEGFDLPARRALQVEEAGTGESGGDGGGVAAVDIVDGDAQARQDGAEEPEGVGVDVANGDDAVAGAEEGEDGRRDGRHAAGEAEGVL